MDEAKSSDMYTVIQQDWEGTSSAVWVECMSKNRTSLDLKPSSWDCRWTVGHLFKLLVSIFVHIRRKKDRKFHQHRFRHFSKCLRQWVSMSIYSCDAVEKEKKHRRTLWMLPTQHTWLWELSTLHISAKQVWRIWLCYPSLVEGISSSSSFPYHSSNSMVEINTAKRSHAGREIIRELVFEDVLWLR